VHSGDRKVPDDDMFSDAAIKKLAEDSKLPPGADLSLFGNFVRAAAALYREEAGWASSAKIRRDVRAIRRTVKPMNERTKDRNPRLIIKALHEASPDTLHMLKRRADNRGEVFPPDDVIINPARINGAVRTLEALTRTGGRRLSRKNTLSNCMRLCRRGTLPKERLSGPPSSDCVQHGAGRSPEAIRSRKRQYRSPFRRQVRLMRTPGRLFDWRADFSTGWASRASMSSI
jgi:hypothetical protein